MNCLYFIISKQLTFRNSKKGSNFCKSVCLAQHHILASSGWGEGCSTPHSSLDCLLQRMTKPQCPQYTEGDPARDDMESPVPPWCSHVAMPPTCPLANLSVQNFSPVSSPNHLSYVQMLSPPLCPLKNLLSPHLWSSWNIQAWAPVSITLRDPKSRELGHGQNGPGSPVCTPPHVCAQVPYSHGAPGAWHMF